MYHRWSVHWTYENAVWYCLHSNMSAVDSTNYIRNWLSWQIAHVCWPVRLQYILEFDVGGIWIFKSHTAGLAWLSLDWLSAGQPALPRGTWLLAAQFHLKQLMSLSSSWVKKSLRCGALHISPAVSVLITLSASVEKCIRNSFVMYTLKFTKLSMRL